ncbi:hypothetical protein ACXXDK_18205 (plasmid) [Deinococcus sp. PESE-38]
MAFGLVHRWEFVVFYVMSVFIEKIYVKLSLGVCGVLVGSLWNLIPSLWEFVEFGASSRWEFVVFSLGVCGIYPKNSVSDGKCAAPLMMHHFFFY